MMTAAREIKKVTCGHELILNPTHSLIAAFFERIRKRLGAEAHPRSTPALAWSMVELLGMGWR